MPAPAAEDRAPVCSRQRSRAAAAPASHAYNGPLRVALLLESDGPGGAEIMLLNLAEALRGRGHRVTPVGPAHGCGWLARAFRGRGFEPEVFRLRRAIDPRLVTDLARLFRDLHIDIVHSHEFAMAVYGAAAARLARRPHVISMHGGTYYAGRWRRRAALRWAIRQSHATVAVAEATRAALEGALGPVGPVRVIPNGIAVPTEPAVPDVTGLATGERILAVGNLYPVKGHAVLLQALSILRRAEPDRDWAAAIVGRGDEEDHLARLAAREELSDRVQLLGFREDVPDLLAEADVFVLPSLSEGLPLALLEAMAAGKAIVASSVGGIPEAARDGYEALLVPPGDPDALADALRRVLAQPDLRARLGRSARARARARFGVDAMADAYERLYRAAARAAAGDDHRPRPAPATAPATPRRAVTRARARALRVQHVISPSPFGGAESVVRALASGQSRNGHAVAVTAILSDGSRRPFLDALEREGVQVFRVAVATRSYLRERAEVAALCRRLGSDILHTHGYRADVVDGGLGRSLAIPAVTTVHGFTGGGAKNRLYESVQRRALRRFDAVVAVSRPLGDGLARSGVPPDRLHVIPNGWGDPGQAVDRAEARRRLRLEDGSFHVAWIGRVAWEKGPDVVVDALPYLGGGLTLHVIGDGPQARSLRARTASDPRIRWHGPVPDAGRLLAAFDALVLSSRTEGTPIVLLEAMAAALPVIATRVGGVPHMVTAAEALLVPPSDPPVLAAAIRAVREDPAGAADRVRAARARLTRDFAIDPWLARYDDVYGAVLAPVQATP